MEIKIFVVGLAIFRGKGRKCELEQIPGMVVPHKRESDVVLPFYFLHEGKK